MLRTFKKGVYPPQLKLTAKKEIVRVPLPEKAVIPLQQHIGAACEPLVKVGDKVSLYQKIGDTKEFCSAPIHASISGTVLDICEHPAPQGFDIQSVVLERSDENEPELKPNDAEKLKPEKLLELIREAGIVGLGGACFPTHIKLKPKEPVDTIILNGSECEPFLTNDHRLMLEHAEEIVKGLKIEMKVLGVDKAHIAIEDNKQDAISKMQESAESDKRIAVVGLKTKYPEGAEKILIKAVLGRECAHSKLPTQVGVVVSNVGTSKAIHDAVYYGKPLVERVITVTGAVKNPQNVLVRTGTPLKEVIDFCGGYSGEPKSIIVGGPMMGVAQSTDKVPLTKASTGIVVQDRIDEREALHCIRCGRCAAVCPYNLMPTMIAKASERGNFTLAESYHALECMECGCCAYVCPSKIPLVQRIKGAKAEIMKKQKSEPTK